MIAFLSLLIGVVLLGAAYAYSDHPAVQRATPWKLGVAGAALLLLGLLLVVASLAGLGRNPLGGDGWAPARSGREVRF